jgi:hypothetical protein
MLERPCDDAEDVMPGVLPHRSSGEGCHWQAHRRPLARLPREIDADSLYGLPPVPLTRHAVAPDTESNQAMARFALASLQVQLADDIEPCLIVKDI